MINKLLIRLGLRKKINTKTIGGYEIIIEGIGFYDIKEGDKFEGAACGHFFSDQVCSLAEDGNEGMVLGTTTLASFRKCNIRPIKENSTPPHIETYGTMKRHENELIKATGIKLK